MSDREDRRAFRRRRRIRNQVISYAVTVVLAAAAVAGCFLGIRAAAGAIAEHRQEREANRQAMIDSSMAAESAEVESAVAQLLDEMESQSLTETETEYTPENALAEMVADSIASMSLEQKVAGLFFVTPEQITGVSQAVQAGEGTREALAKYPVGGLIYFEKNIQSGEQLQEMLSNTVSYSAFPLFLGVDEEGGSVARVAKALKLDNVGDMAKIGASGDPQAAYGAMQTIGTYLASYGFNVDFAPVADVLTNPDNTVIGKRAFSSDAQTAASMVASAVQGLQETGISACMKHFPGHGDTAEDSHEGLAETARTKEQMKETEFLPFQAGIDAGCNMIMIGHITAPELTGGSSIPASLSEEIVTGILRSELGYNGIVITDAMSMSAITEYYESDVAAIMALKAGADMVLMPEDFEQAYEGVLKAVKDGTISEERVNDSLTRIYTVKLQGAVE